MQKVKSVLLLAALLAVAGCYEGITGTVVDAETDRPIEGAVVLVEWTKTTGIGFTSTHSYKVAETVTDKEGKFKLPGVWSPFVNEPHLTIYKRGYVAWNNEYIFPGNKKRSDYKWGTPNIYLLERFQKEYSFIEHQAFIDGVAYLFSETEKKSLFLKAYDEWEQQKAIEERRAKRTNRI